MAVNISTVAVILSKYLRLRLQKKSGNAACAAVHDAPGGFEWGWLLIGAAWWLASHPYWGIWHDARVYTLMAVRWLTPEAFARDPWFMFGSQDAFTLFSPLYGSTVAWLGVEPAAKAWAFGLGMAFVLASWVISRAVSRSHYVFLFFTLVAVPWVYCANSYDVIGEMRISESFVTSRHLAVSLSLLGVAAVMGGRWFVAAAWFAGGLAIHPLIAIWPLLVACGVKLRLPAKWLALLAAVGVLLVLGMAWFALPGFHHLAGDWADYVRHTAKIVYPGEGGTHRIEFAATCYALLACGFRWGTPRLRRWYFCTLLVAAGAYAVYWFCSVLAPSVIVMQVQPWRANWLALLFAAVAALDLTVRGARLSSARRLLTLSAWTAGLAAGWVVVALLGALAMLPGQFLRLAGRLARGPHRVAIFRGLAVVLALIFCLWLASAWADVEMLVPALPSQYRGAYAQTALLSAILFSGVGGVLPLLAAACIRGRGHRASLLVGLALFPLAIWTWDQPREPRLQDSFRRSGGEPRSLFSGLVTQGATVYWQGRPEYVWFLLGTASYASSVQAIGIVFSEPMTFELARRLQRIALADLDAAEAVGTGREALVQHFLARGLSGFEPRNLHAYERTTMTEAGLRLLCKDPQLDFVIHDRAFPPLVRATEIQSGPRNSTVWNLYRCADLRSDFRARTT